MVQAVYIFVWLEPCANDRLRSSLVMPGCASFTDSDGGGGGTQEGQTSGKIAYLYVYIFNPPGAAIPLHLPALSGKRLGAPGGF